MLEREQEMEQQEALDQERRHDGGLHDRRQDNFSGAWVARAQEAHSRRRSVLARVRVRDAHLLWR